MSSETVVIMISSILILGGILGSVLPFLPGPPLAWAGLLLYGYSTDFQTVSVRAVVIFGILSLLTVVLDIFAPALLAKGYKASRFGVIGAIVGTFAGIIFLGPFGIVIGPFVGAFLGEYWKARDEQKAMHIAWGALIGFFVSTSVRILVTLAMTVYFLAVLLR